MKWNITGQGVMQASVGIFTLTLVTTQRGIVGMLQGTMLAVVADSVTEAKVALLARATSELLRAEREVAEAGCQACAEHYCDDKGCDQGKPAASPHRGNR